MSAERFPFDYAGMTKGDYIAPERLEHITGLTRGTDRYAIALMAMRDRIERELWDRGKQITVKTERGGIRLMDDPSASRYNHRRVNGAIRQAIKCHVRNLGVEVANLTEDQRKDHERYVEVDGKVVQAIATVRPHLAPRPVQRTVPGLPQKT